MRDSIGGAMLLNLVIIFTGLVIVFFVSILSYSKAYKVKNRIIEIIEKYETYSGDVVNELNYDLKNIGYSTTTPAKCDERCNDIREELVRTRYKSEDLAIDSLNNSGYNYCVFSLTNNNEGFSYLVVTFVRFEVPIVGDILTFPVYGETKILEKDYNY